MERRNRRGGAGSDRDRKDAEKLQLEEPSPAKPDLKGIAQKKTNSGGNRLAAAAPPYPLKKRQNCKGTKSACTTDNKKKFLLI